MLYEGAISLRRLVEAVNVLEQADHFAIQVALNDRLAPYLAAGAVVLEHFDMSYIDLCLSNGSAEHRLERVVILQLIPALELPQAAMLDTVISFLLNGRDFYGLLPVIMQKYRVKRSTFGGRITEYHSPMVVLSGKQTDRLRSFDNIIDNGEE